MAKAGSQAPDITPPLWLLAELTYACPLQCPYCSNPVDFVAHGQHDLETEDWIRVLSQARALGAVQLGLSGGEPLVRRDLEEIIAEARSMGFYSNLITSAVGMDAKRISRFKESGLDHIQISFQAGHRELNDMMAGTDAFAHKKQMAREVKAQGFPMVLNFVLYRKNIDFIREILDMAIALDADQVELANTQYYGWAFQNRKHLLPTREQLKAAEQVANEYQQRYADKTRIIFVVPDYYEERPKACMDGWGRIFLSVSPDGVALPCQGARMLPGLEFPNVRDHDVRWIWYESDAFNRFRGEDWMKQPCRTCPERSRDYGGCRCQAYLLTGDPANADPVCSLSPQHDKIKSIIAEVNSSTPTDPLLFRNAQNSRQYIRSQSR